MSATAGVIPVLPARSKPLDLVRIGRHALHVALAIALPLVGLAGAVGAVPPAIGGIGAGMIVLAIGAGWHQ